MIAIGDCGRSSEKAARTPFPAIPLRWLMRPDKTDGEFAELQIWTSCGWRTVPFVDAPSPDEPQAAEVIEPGPPPIILPMAAEAASDAPAVDDEEHREAA